MAVHRRVAIRLPGEPPVHFDTAQPGTIRGRRPHDLRGHASGKQAERVDVDRMGNDWRVRVIVSAAEPGVVEFSPNSEGHFLAQFDGRTDMRVRVSECTDNEPRPRIGSEFGELKSVRWSLVRDPVRPGVMREQLQIVAANERSLDDAERNAERRTEPD
jgi:hypothetical protein